VEASVSSTIQAIRGAIQIGTDDADVIVERTARLLGEVIKHNGLSDEDIVSIMFTATPDLTAAFPAAAARRLGLVSVPLMCAAEIAVPGALPRVVRLLAHVRTGRPRSAIRHVYLDGAEALRPDLATAGADR
jgi:chorismate mutase